MRFANPFSGTAQTSPGSARWLSLQLGGSGIANASGWHNCCCPGHSDLHASLSLKDTPLGLLAKCFAGCPSDVVRAALLDLPRHGRPQFAAVTGRTPRDLRGIAARIWQESQPIGGSLAERYLRARGITGALPATLRFHPAAYHAEGQVCAPALIALVQSAAGEKVGIHRTWIAPDGSGKATLDPVRKALGPIAGHAVHLGEPNGELLAAEGIETALSAMQIWGGCLAAWAALSATNLANLIVPAAVTVTIAGDNDEAGRTAAVRLRDRLRQADPARVTVYLPRNGRNDFNDALRGS
jgi:hypothetical protein